MLKKILLYLNIQSEIEDFEEIHSTIEKGLVFRGTNLWILVAAIVIASVGLNTNSTAVIIGAMLISPLMGPINGMGYSIAINDFRLFRRSINNFTFAVFASLVASTAYFAISPVGNAQSELLARTSPTIYDVLIALFGGFAGIIAISSKQKGNVIPGVAIATALMPPMCTAGYGLGTGQFNFFFGAIYLFTINTVCIALASTVVSQLLKFPIWRSISDSRKRRINHILSIVLIITILPSIYLGYKLVQNEEFLINAEKYAESVSIYKGNYLLKNDIDKDNRHIHFVYGGTSLTKEDKNQIMSRASDFNIDYQNVSIEQGLSLSGITDIISKNVIQENSLKLEISRLNEVVKVSEAHLDSIYNLKNRGKQLLNEITPLYPQITSCSYSETYVYSADSTIQPIKKDVVIFSISKDISLEEKERIKRWLEKRLKSTSLTTIYN